ncbi:MAG: hypothetical protein AAB794_00390 [Patescibacteria group bacterium]
MDEHSSFYFPFLVMCKEYSDEDDDFVEIESNEWEMIEEDGKYQTFQLWENLQNLDLATVRLLSAGFIQEITNSFLELHIATLRRNYRRKWKERLTENANIEDFGLNEFIEGKFRGYEDCLDLIKFYRS